VDASALIVLEKTGRLELLLALYSPVLAPSTVVQAFATPTSWLEVAMPAALLPSEAEALRPVAGRGEADVIALARDRGTAVVLDDRQARSVARLLGVPLLGTMRVLLRAKRASLVPAGVPRLDALDAEVFRLRAGRSRRSAATGGGGRMISFLHCTERRGAMKSTWNRAAK
jgi:predicted nucleic acid-binding protein